MPATKLISASLCLAAIAFVTARPANADEARNQRVAAGVSGGEARSILGLQALSPSNLEGISQLPTRVQQITREVYTQRNQPPSGDVSQPLAYVQDFLSGLDQYGIQQVGKFVAETGIPHQLRPSVLKAGETSIALNPLYPNGAMPSLTPEGGLKGSLVDVGSGSWEELNGLNLTGAICLMDFAGSRNWERLFSLGAIAVIVLEDETVSRPNAQGLFCNTPIAFPRFYADQSAAEQLRNLAATSPEVTLEGGNAFRRTSCTSLFAYLPPLAPLQVHLTGETVLELFAPAWGVTEDSLVSANPSLEDGLQEGEQVKLPDGSTRQVDSGELIDLFAAKYDLATSALLSANPDGIKVGATVTIPNFETPMVVISNLDSTSVVPDAPHGAISSGNLASVLATLEYLCKSADLSRRRGILFAFLDGDVHGGVATRTLTEDWLRAEDGLNAKYSGDSRASSDIYAEALEGLNFEGRGALGEQAAEWLGSEWLGILVEKYRVEVAERRVELIKQQLASDSPEEVAELEKKVSAQQELIDSIAKLRDTTITNKDLAWPERIRSFFQSPAFADGAQPRLPFTPDQIVERLAREREEIDRQEAYEKLNSETVAKLREILPPGSNAFGYAFDLSDGSTTLGFKTSPRERFRGAVPFPVGYIQNMTNRLRDLVTLAAVRAGWAESVLFYSDRDKVDVLIEPYEAVPYFPDFWARMGVSLLPLGTLNDRLTLLDTPHDTLDYINFERLGVNARTAALLVSAGLESAVDSTPVPDLIQRQFGSLTGRAVQFNIRSGIDAQEPVAGATVYYPSLSKSSTENTSTFRGARVGLIMETALNGRYRLPLESINFNVAGSLPNIYAYFLDPEEALFVKVVNQGQVGTQKRTAQFTLAAGTVLEKNLVMTDVYPRMFSTGSDPMDYTTLGSPGQTIKVVDAILEGEPQHYAVANPITEYKEEDVLSTVLFLQSGRRARVTVQQGTIFRMILPGEVTDEFPLGRGFLVGQKKNDRNLNIPLTPLVVASEMLQLAERRRDLYAQYGITDQAVNLAIDRSREKLALAEKNVTERDWQGAIGSARESWGILVKLYPSLLKLGRDAVFSVILLMVLLVPAAFFLEKLIIGSKTIVAQLAGAVGIFIAGVFFLRFFHPAFQISVSPFIVVIAFTMILMSVIVLAISYGRFEVLLGRARAAGGEVEGEKAGLAATLGTALSLGVSNLKKRPSRTFLTSFTVTMLTFSIVAFVSVRGTDDVARKPVYLDADAGGKTVDAKQPAYEGILFREYFWSFLPENFVTALRAEFGSRFEMTTRGYYIEVEGGSSADREGANQIFLETPAGGRHIVRGVMTFAANEPEFTKFDEALIAGSWFSDAGFSDRHQLILPSTAAEALGLSAADLADPNDLPTVRMMKRDWKVVGIIDVDEADRIRDVNGKSLAMVDYLRSAFSKNIRGELAAEPGSYHLSWEDLVLVPNTAAKDVGAKTRSVAIKLPEGQEEFFQDIALRLNRTFFGYWDDQMALVSSKKTIGLGGLAKIIVPVILCVLIVTNTMLGTVEERKGEVGMLGAIGLSPSQISFLLLSESAVFSVLGVVFGVFGGLAFANLAPWIASTFGILGGLSFNFTSVVAMLLAMGTALVVMLATLLPAKKAAALAAPSGMAKWSLPDPGDTGKIHFELPFTLTRGNALGMVSFFRQFLGNHTDATSQGFNCRDIRAGFGDGQRNLELSATMWLSPYDLDVAQQMLLKMEPSDSAGVARVVLELTRQSGTEEAWIRTNYGFLDMVRKQFLLWRNMTPEMRDKYIERGRDLLTNSTQ